MSEIENIEEKIQEKTLDKTDKELYGELRNTIIETRDKYQNQVREIKDKLEKSDEERKALVTLRDKLQGAIEASDFYTKAVLPTNKPK